MLSFNPEIHCLSSKGFSAQGSSLQCAAVCVCAALMGDHSLSKLWGEITADYTLWNPQAPVLHPSISPSLSLFCLLPCWAPCYATDSNASTSILHPSLPSHELPNTYRSFVLVRLTAKCELFPIRDRLFVYPKSPRLWSKLLSCLIPLKLTSHRPQEQKLPCFPLVQVQLLASFPISKPQTTEL